MLSRLCGRDFWPHSDVILCLELAMAVHLLLFFHMVVLCSLIRLSSSTSLIVVMTLIVPLGCCAGPALLSHLHLNST